MSKNFFLVTLSRIQKSGALFDINNPEFFPCDVISVDIPKTVNETNDFKDNITLSKNIIQKIWSNENDAIIIQASIQKA